MVPPTLALLGSVLVVVAAAPNCSSTSGDRVDPSMSVADTLVAGCSGGFTGGGGGVAVTGTGDLLTWNSPGPSPAAVEWRLVGRDPTAATRLFSRLATVKFDQTDFNNPSNMTCYLTLRAGGKSHEVAWPMGQRPPKIVAIIALYDDVRTTVERR